MPTFPIALERARLAADHAAQIISILRQTSSTPDAPTTEKHIASPAGDEAKLRGIPVVGARGVGGAINGSRPGGNLR